MSELKVAIGFPVLGGIPGATFHSFLRLAARFGQDGIKHEVIIGIDIVPYDRAREYVIDQALARGCTHLLFIDCDNDVPEHTFNQLYASMQNLNAQAVCGHYLRRRYPYTSVWSHVVDGKRIPVEADEPVQIDSSGLGCALIDLQWVKSRLTRPYFLLGQDEAGNPIWEDSYFFGKIIAAGGTVFGDPAVRCGHLAAQQMVTDDNADFLRANNPESG
jgi:hypothetical protein